MTAHTPLQPSVGQWPTGRAAGLANTPSVLTPHDQVHCHKSRNGWVRCLVRDRRGHLLADWVREAETNGPGPVRGFAGFLRQGWDAVLAVMTLDYSSGAVEGHVNRLTPFILVRHDEGCCHRDPYGSPFRQAYSPGGGVLALTAPEGPDGSVVLTRTGRGDLADLERKPAHYWQRHQVGQPPRDPLQTARFLIDRDNQPRTGWLSRVAGVLRRNSPGDELASVTSGSLHRARRRQLMRAAAHADEGEEVLGLTFVAAVQAAAGEPGDRPFDDPAVAAQPCGGLDSLAGDAVTHTPLTEPLTQMVVVVSLVGLKLGRTPAGGGGRPSSGAIPAAAPMSSLPGRPGGVVASYSVGMVIAIHQHVLKIPVSARIPALETDGEIRDGAWAAELTGDVLDGRPKGMRLIVGKERPYPGARLTHAQQRATRTIRIP